MIDRPISASRSSLLRGRRRPHLCIVLILLFGSFLNLSAQAPVAGHSLAAPTTAPDAGRWRIEIAASQGFMSGPTSLALDGDRHPHIGYFYDNDGFNREVRYAYQDPGGWHIVVVDTGGDIGFGISLALDGSGWPHISYANGSNGDLKYARQNGTGWHVELVDTQPGGPYTSLALDHSGYPHIAYPTSDYDLKVAWQDAGGWHTEIVDSGNTNGDPSLALDDSGYSHISYPELTGDLKYAYQDAAGWHLEVVDSEGYDAVWTSLALDGGGYPHISYYEHYAGDLRYAYKDAGGWHIEIVDSGDIFGGMSLALDGSGYPHIAYHDVRRSLRYAYQDADGWHLETVDSGGCDSGFSLALDGSSYPHISYCASGPVVKYASGDLPDLSESVKRVSPLHPAPGDRVTYTLALANAGIPPATFALTDPLPLQVTYVPGSAWANGGIITAANGITWTGIISPGFHLTATFAVTVDAGITLPTAVINSAVLSGDPDGLQTLVAGFILHPLRVYLPLFVGEDWSP